MLWLTGHDRRECPGVPGAGVSRGATVLCALITTSSLRDSHAYGMLPRTPCGHAGLTTIPSLRDFDALRPGAVKSRAEAQRE